MLGISVRDFSTYAMNRKKFIHMTVFSACASMRSDLRDILGMGISWGHLGDILRIYWGYLGHILGISKGYLGDIWRMSWGYLGHILAISWEYFGDIFCDILGISGGYLLEF